MNGGFSGSDDRALDDWSWRNPAIHIDPVMWSLKSPRQLKSIKKLKLHVGRYVRRQLRFVGETHGKAPFPLKLVTPTGIEPVFQP
jgi:hypothetical protein